MGIVDLCCVNHTDTVTHHHLFKLPIHLEVYALPYIVPLVLGLVVSIVEVLRVVEGHDQWFSSVEIDAEFVFILEYILLFVVDLGKHFFVELDIDVQNSCDLCWWFFQVYLWYFPEVHPHHCWHVVFSFSCVLDEKWKRQRKSMRNIITLIDSLMLLWDEVALEESFELREFL